MLWVHIGTEEERFVCCHIMFKSESMSVAFFKGDRDLLWVLYRRVTAFKVLPLRLGAMQLRQR